MPSKHTVVAGDCIASIAYENGLHPDHLWNDPANEELQALRENGHVLQPGDVVHVPDRRPREESCVTGRRHSFRRLAVPERLRIALLDAEGKPRPGVAYALELGGGRAQRGTTDAEGKLMLWIPPAATHGALHIGDEPPVKLRLGHLAPVDTDEGLRARLANLGHLRATDTGPEGLADAVIRFQQAARMTPTGTIDADLRRALLEAHGS